MKRGRAAIRGLTSGLLGIGALVALLTTAADHEAPRAAGEATMTTEDVVTGASFPVTLAFAPDGRLFYAELCTGNVRIVLPDDTLLPDPFVNAGSVLCYQDYGFIGLALDPDFETNHYVYVQYMELTSPDPLIWRPVIKRFTEAANVGTDPTVLLIGPDTDPTRSRAHGADNIHFGPDGHLYTSIGDLDKNVGEVQVSQDLSRLEGKILRLDKTDGSAPADNPFVSTPGADPRVYAYGFRNSFGFTFHETNGMLYATENGPDRCDELNIVVAGGNYGWPIPYEGSESCAVPVGIQPIYWFTFFLGYPPWLSNQTSAPTGIEYIDGDAYPSLGDSLLVCNWRNSQMRHLTLAPSYDDVTSEDTLLTDCSLDVQINPATGAIYYSNAGAIRRLLVDSDSDTVIDGADNCPDTANSGQENSVHPLTPAGDHCEDPEPDGVFDISDSCPDAANPGQENTDGDQWGDACDNCPSVATVWLVPPDDGDCDGWTDADEGAIGTDPAVACDDGELQPDWPPDFDDNRVINILDVGMTLPPYFGTTVPPTSARRDLDPNGFINILDVGMTLPPYFGASCT